MHPYCQQVLTERMEEGRLDRASIHSDVRTLHPPPVTEPEILVGGFPCQDISSIGLRKGIAEGSRSSLFYEMMRIADECPSIRVLFLENVANIVKCGLKEVVDECAKRGFNLQWTVLSAGDQGAPHLRRRWFALAVRGPEFDVSRLGLPSAPGLSVGVENAWTEEPSARVSFRPNVADDPSYDPQWSVRCQCLGNAVVPAVARRAFIDLVQMHRHWASMAACLSAFGVPAEDLAYPYPEAGLVFEGRFFALPRSIKTVKPQQQQEPDHGVLIHLDCGEDAPRKLENYPTPRRGITHASSLTARSTHDLPSVLVHCLETRRYVQERCPEALAALPEGKMHTIVHANVNYIEWMMGYAPDWTKVARPKAPATDDVACVSAASADDDDLEDEVDLEDPMRPQRAGRAGRGRGRGRGVRGLVAYAGRRARAEKATYNLNGMHVLMREHPGKDVRTVAAIWKALTDEERALYTARARGTPSGYTVVDSVVSSEQGVPV
jgi:hypothetical protein